MFGPDESELVFGYVDLVGSTLTHLYVVDSFKFFAGYSQYIGKHATSFYEKIDEPILLQKCSSSAMPIKIGRLLSYFLRNNSNFVRAIQQLPENITHLAYGSYFGTTEDFYTLSVLAVLKFKGQYQWKDRNMFMIFKLSCPYPDLADARSVVRFQQEVHYVEMALQLLIPSMKWTKAYKIVK